MPPHDPSLERLRRTVRGYGSALVAFSGGVDSALVAAVAHQELGQAVLACVGVSPSYPEREQQQALDLLRELGLPHRRVELSEHRDPAYAANDGQRCFHCKSHLYGRLRRLAAEEGFAIVLDGANADDPPTHVGGIPAASEQGVASPLLELGLGKARVRELARELGLPVWDKPAMACLASRVPRGARVTPALLRQIEQAEAVLYDLGFTDLRVRHHGELARIELPIAELPQALIQREAITQGLQRAGYTLISLDLAGRPAEPAIPLTLRQSEA